MLWESAKSVAKSRASCLYGIRLEGSFSSQQNSNFPGFRYLWQWFRIELQQPLSCPELKYLSIKYPLPRSSNTSKSDLVFNRVGHLTFGIWIGYKKKYGYFFKSMVLLERLNFSIWEWNTTSFKWVPRLGLQYPIRLTQFFSTFLIVWASIPWMATSISLVVFIHEN